ncbi:hypothetical protein LX36DRAFT_576941 [Colletotrichum falcatum]|nr:hypothetical protein LX36DRAFT_576941 [Colletotrichum falcatum]
MPPGRPRLDLEPYRDEIVEAFNRRETVESMIKGLAARGVEVNGKTFQRRMREWGLYRYAKTPKKKRSVSSGRTSTVGSNPDSVAAAAAAAASSVTQPALQPITQQDGIPDSVSLLLHTRFPMGQLQESNGTPSCGLRGTTILGNPGNRIGGVVHFAEDL